MIHPHFRDALPGQYLGLVVRIHLHDTNGWLALMGDFFHCHCSNYHTLITVIYLVNKLSLSPHIQEQQHSTYVIESLWCTQWSVKNWENSHNWKTDGSTRPQMYTWDTSSTARFATRQTATVITASLADSCCASRSARELPLYKSSYSVIPKLPITLIISKYIRYTNLSHYTVYTLTEFNNNKKTVATSDTDLQFTEIKLTSKNAGKAVTCVHIPAAACNRLIPKKKQQQQSNTLRF